MLLGVPRRPWAPLAALALLASCDAIVGLGEEPHGSSTTTASSAGSAASGSGGAASSSGASGTVTSSSGTSSTGGGGDAGQGGEGAGGDGQGGDGQGGALDAPCGRCGDPSCLECDRDDDRCTARRWLVPDTDRGDDSIGAIVDRFGRSVLVTNRYIVLSRRRVGNTPAQVVTLIDLLGGQPFDLATLIPGSVAGLAIADDDRRVAVISVSSESPLFRLDLGEVDLDLTPVVPSGASQWGQLVAGGGTRMFLVPRYNGEVYAFDIARDEPAPCRAAQPDVGLTTIAAAAVEGRVDVLAASDSRVVTMEGTLDCDPVVNGTSTPLRFPLDQGNAILIQGDRVYVQGIDGASSVLFRNDSEEGNQIETYPSAALAARTGDLFVAAPEGGVVRCNEELDELTVDGCTEVLSADLVHQVSLLTARPWGFVAVGFDDQVSEGDATVMCIDDRTP